MSSTRADHIILHDELHICPACGYDRGFHTSLVRIAEGHPHFRCILICPECGARYDIKWMIEIK